MLFQSHNTMEYDSTKTLEELEGDIWSTPDTESYLVAECHRLRSIPVEKLSVGDLRILIGQKIGLIYLVPVALRILEMDPFIEGNIYKGDLLSAVASVGNDFWSKHPELNNWLVAIKNDLEILAETLVNELLPALNSFSYK